MVLLLEGVQSFHRKIRKGTSTYLSRRYPPCPYAPVCHNKGAVGGRGYRFGLPVGLFRHNARPQCPKDCHNPLYPIDFIELY